MRGARPFAALESQVAASIAARRDEVIVAAVSGGADSAALAALAAKAARDAGATLVLAHVNHGVRRSAWQDEAVVLSLGAALGVRVVCAGLEPGPASEARLRRGRYRELARIARLAGAKRLLTAHHAADQTETVLLALFRGTAGAGLRGMPVTRALGAGLDLVRPLLGVEPERLRAYGSAEHLPIAVDPTNVDMGYRRNALRAVLPVLRASFPHLDAAVARCAAIAAQELDGNERAGVRARLRAEIVARTGDATDVTFERLDAAAKAIERNSAGRHFLRRGVELVIR